MSVQIAVRLPDDLVAKVDLLVADGAGSRASVVTDALNRYLQHLQAERDARIYRETGDYDDFDGLYSLEVPDLDA